MTLATGAILDNRYRIVKLVGQGGFGAVYRAWHLSLDLPVALKENRDTGPESQRQFEREARLLAGLRHHNLPRVIDHFVVPGQGQYLVMDFVEGKSLQALLVERGGPLDEAEVLPWVLQVCDALTYLHTRTPPIIHRDVKPDNIIITNDGRAMLVDFGISKLYDPSKGTTVGAKAVTPGYSPPEQYGRGRTGAWSDVYSLGATLYTLLTGQVPPEAPDLSSGADALTPLAEANRAVSAATSRAIEAAMALSISQRLASASVFTEALPTIVAPTVRVAPPVVGATLPLGYAPPPLDPPPVSSTARHGMPVWGWLFGVAALVALAVWAGMAFGGWNGGGQEPEATAADAVVVVNTPRPTVTDRPTATTTPTPRPSPTPRPALTPTITLTPQPQAGDIRVVNRGGVEVEQVYVPTGSFMMGSEDGFEDERPVHEVTLDAFWIDRTEMTNAQYAACVADGACEPPAYNMSFKRTSYYDNAEYTNYPVVYVNWDKARDFCEWAGSRLPTEAEWEYAARGPESMTYPWGNTPPSCSLLNYNNTCVGDTTEAGAYTDGASWVGALDMAGNVWEWVQDWYDPGYYGRSPAENPTGLDSGEYQVLRGGTWLSQDFSVRSAFRNDGSRPVGRGYFLGLRCAGLD